MSDEDHFHDGDYVNKQNKNKQKLGKPKND